MHIYICDALFILYLVISVDIYYFVIFLTTSIARLITISGFNTIACLFPTSIVMIIAIIKL